jgi:long-chain acyl-CoA synthetase
MTAPQDLVTLAEESCRRFADRPLCGEKRDGAWTWATYADFGRAVDELRGGLAGLGVGPGDRVGIVSRNRGEWAVAAFATYGLEAAFVPMYEAQRPQDWQLILGDAGVRVVFGSGDRAVDALRAIQARLPGLEHVIGLDLPEADPSSYAALLARGRAAPVPARHPSPEAVATLIYTSGTTGRPKGTILTHRNITSNVAAVRDLFPLAADDRSLSFLPWAHSFGQVCELYVGIATGLSAALNRDVAQLVDDLVEVKPTILVAVPRIFQRLHDGVLAQIAGKPAVIRALFRAGLRAARHRREHEGLGPVEALELRLAERLIFSKIRERFGGRLRYAFSGSATLSPDAAELVDAIGIPVYEGYGLTETSPVVTANRPGARKLGSVGQVIAGVTIRIDETAAAEPGQGEIVVYGPNVMKGYHDRPEETAAALTADGGLRTGDLGYLDADGYLYITGRIKEQYKLDNGKYVSPAPLEQQLALSPYIAAAMIHGDGRPHNVALIVLDVPAVRAWAEREGVELGADPAASPAVRALIDREIEREAAGFRAFERPRAVALVAEDFTVGNGMLTPTLKIKRRDILARYGALLDGLYAPAPSERPAPVARP